MVTACALWEVALPSPAHTNYTLKDVSTVCQPPGRGRSVWERLREKEHVRAVNIHATYTLCGEDSLAWQPWPLTMVLDPMQLRSM